MRTLIAVAAIVVCSWVSASFADNASRFKINNLDFDNIPVIEIEAGHHGEITMDPTLRNVGQGLAPIYLYRLPKYASQQQLVLTTVVNRKRVFNPIVLLLNDDYQAIDTVKGDVSLNRVSQVEVSSSMPIVVQPHHKYMLITTDPAYFGKKLSYKKMITSIVKVYDGNNMKYVPVTSGTRDVNVVMANSGRLVLSAPYQDY
ncbi:hypothetical protein [Kaarinaea lacus]